MSKATEAKHTPGPWSWRRTSLPGCRLAGDWLYNYRLGNENGGRVGVVDQISHADADILELAPDLLAMCERLHDLLLNGGDSTGLVTELGNLIADAKGESRS